MKLLEMYCENMEERALQTEPVIGREAEIAMLMQILCRKNKNNPALIGEPGVGKTAIVEGFAQRLAAGNVPEVLRSKKLLSLNMASVLAGTKYRGEFEERIRDIIAEVKRCGNVILFIDEMHTLVGAGSAEGAIDAANLLKPALGRGEIQVIGATTLEEYRRHIEKDAALERRFRPLIVREPSKDETVKMLLGLREGLEQHHELTITKEAIEAAVELSCRYVTDRFLPDKALDLLDESASRAWMTSGGSSALQTKKQNLSESLEKAVEAGDFERAAILRDKLQSIARRQMRTLHGLHVRSLTAQDVAAAVSERTGIPAGKLTMQESERMRSLKQALSDCVIGQEQAVLSCARAVIRGRTGLADHNRPIASMLFMGPTGVGKTELCKALADCVYASRDALIRLDMSEYMEPNSVSRLIGAPPGYVGYEEGGTLTDLVRRRPYCVVLFDELEKAHRDVTNLLLQILDDGILTDRLGRTADFRNCMIVMTSNVGSVLSAQAGVGFTPPDRLTQAKKLLSEYFSPELLGRMDCIIPFEKLSTAQLSQIADKLLQKTAQRAKEQGVTLEIDEQTAEKLARDCEREKSGARSLRHQIQSQIEEPAAELLLVQPSLRSLHIFAEKGKIEVAPLP